METTSFTRKVTSFPYVTCALAPRINCYSGTSHPCTHPPSQRANLVRSVERLRLPFPGSCPSLFRNTVRLLPPRLGVERYLPFYVATSCTSPTGSAWPPPPSRQPRSLPIGVSPSSLRSGRSPIICLRSWHQAFRVIVAPVALSLILPLFQAFLRLRSLYPGPPGLLPLRKYQPTLVARLVYFPASAFPYGNTTPTL